MKRTDIIKGECYSDGKGRIRKILDIGPQYKYYRLQRTDDCLCYILLQDKHSPQRIGEIGCLSTAGFMSWAKERVPEIPMIPYHPAIAYLDKNNKGLTPHRSMGADDPFLEEGFESVQEALDRAKEMTHEGYKLVRVFIIPDNVPLPDILDWNYVSMREIKADILR